MVQDTS